MDHEGSLGEGRFGLLDLRLAMHGLASARPLPAAGEESGRNGQ